MADQELAPLSNQPFVTSNGKLTQYGAGLIRRLFAMANDTSAADAAGADASAAIAAAKKAIEAAESGANIAEDAQSSFSASSKSLNSDLSARPISDEGLKLAQKAWKRANAAFSLASASSLPGDIRMSGSSSVPTGWLACDGSAVSRTTYADLFSAIGTAFGAGDGSTTFNVPDFDEHVPYGSGTESIGAVVGANEKDLQHDHAVGTLATGSAGAHDHGGATGAPSATVNRTIVGDPTASATHTHTISSDGAHTHTVTGSTANGLTTTEDIRQASLAVKFIIKT